MNTDNPVYGIVAHHGGWTVLFRRTHNSTGQLQGYGEFPRDRFPSIPVVRFDQAEIDAVMACIRGPIEQTACKDTSMNGRLSLDQYLSKIMANGVPIDYGKMI